MNCVNVLPPPLPFNWAGQNSQRDVAPKKKEQDKEKEEEEEKEKKGRRRKRMPYHIPPLRDSNYPKGAGPGSSGIQHLDINKEVPHLLIH
jgi:hypothetical protein